MEHLLLYLDLLRWREWQLIICMVTGIQELPSTVYRMDYGHVIITLFLELMRDMLKALAGGI